MRKNLFYAPPYHGFTPPLSKTTLFRTEIRCNVKILPRKTTIPKNKVGGFTLIEILIVIATLSILASAVIINFHDFQLNADLNNEAEKILNIVKLAQNKTLASEEGSSYGIHLENNLYVLFKGQVYSNSSIDNLYYELLPSVEIYEINLNGGGQDIIFNRVTGETSQSGNFKLKLKSSDSRTETISVISSGHIFSGAANSYPNPQNSDTRHIHFTYNKGIKAANILKLYFPDENFIYNINFQSYLNDSKDEFIWADSIAVENQNQKLEIKTHFLTDTSAQFSIHRDRRYNNKALQVFIDDDNLINHALSGVAAKGDSPFVSEPEIQ